MKKDEKDISIYMVSVSICGKSFFLLITWNRKLFTT